MLPQNKPDRIRIVFDDHRLVANAGLLLPATLARHLGLRELVDHHLDLGGAPGRANTGDKMLTLVASALAGGDCIDDADALRTGGTACTLGGTLKAPSTLGTFLRSFRWGHVRQLDRVSRKVLAWRVSVTIDTDFCVEALEESLGRHGAPEIFNTDQGSQFTSDAFTGLLKANGIQISMDGKGSWKDNVFVERLWKSVKYEEVYLRAYESVPEARTGLGRYFEFYNAGRPHSSLGGMTPDQFFDRAPAESAAA